MASTNTSFRARFSNHKSSLNSYGKGQKGTCGEHLYAHFWEEGHRGLDNVVVQIIDDTDVRINCVESHSRVRNSNTIYLRD